MTSLAARSSRVTRPSMHLARAALSGLAATPKAISSKWLYDRRGSELFERITHLPEYYPTGCEIEILARHAGEMAELIGPDATIVEFGSGSSRKTPLLLEALDRPRAYAPLDIAVDILLDSAQVMARRFPDLIIAPQLTDFTEEFRLDLRAVGGRRAIGFFPGSTIGNFHPREAVRFLRRAAMALGNDAAMIIGVDLQKDLDILIPAYDDAEGVTAEFNRNLLHRMNRELGADFDPDSFGHEAFYDAKANRIEMHLVSRRRQTVHLLERTFPFRLGEIIHTENSYKYTVGSFRSLAHIAGWSPREVWLDERGLFSLHYLTVDHSSAAAFHQ